MPSTVDAYRSGSTEPWTVDVLCALVRAKQPKFLLELGTYLGLTTERLADAMPTDARLLSVECDERRWQEATKRFLHDDRIHIAHSDALAFLREYTGPGFDFVFVDDDHDKQHVAAELTLLHNWQGKSLMAPGGLICCHDVVGIFGLDAVVTAHYGYVLDLPLLHPAGGLGLIQIPRPSGEFAAYDDETGTIGKGRITRVKI